ncbi:outer membrane protein [Piscirickettsia litoralis]|uniref:Outer membrane protein OmpA-like transmembrane domain-containing protein n=1 Tax=Piscirickettsia litoralis TaxID=1891921 RepID=A0ABX3A6I0_9GAMM|nr:outer membrane beta-barrel protein [Piscirickettsia litoralis]ODN44058.1 hypothetical protein BGC07_09480 [Piscirickettsia litoralis]
MKKILIATAVATALVSGAAIAKPGAYVGLNLGLGGMDTPKWDTNKLPANTSDKEERGGLAGRIDAGYLWGQGPFNYGVEMGFASYANNTYKISSGSASEELKYSGYNVDLLGVAQYNFTPNWNIFGKAGVAYVHQKTEISVADGGLSATPFSKSENKLLPEVAIGGGYQFANGLGLNLTVSHIFGSKPHAWTDTGNTEDNMTSVASVNMLTFGISYNF